VQDDKVEEGTKLLADAALQLLDDGDVQYHYAAALAKQGATADAEARLRTLLGRKHEFASRADAERLLASLGKGAGSGP
jgi:hypothetical protein